jgi:para-aminobenzoate synthetase component 1
MGNFKIAYLNSNNGHSVLAFGKGEAIRIDSNTVNHTSALVELEQFIQQNKNSYLFGYLSYDLKNEIHNLDSNNNNSVEFPLIYFWKPQYVVEMKNENFSFVQGEKCQESFDFVQNFLEEEIDQNFHPYNFNFKPTITKKEYIEKVNSLRIMPTRGAIDSALVYEGREVRFLIFKSGNQFEIKILYLIDQLKTTVSVIDFFPTKMNPLKKRFQP